MCFAFEDDWAPQGSSDWNKKNQWLESPTGTSPPFPSDLSRFGSREGVCTCPWSVSAAQGPALTCLWESHREPSFQGKTAKACEPRLQAKVSPAETPLVCSFSHLLGVSKGRTHPLAPGDWPESCELGPHPALGDCLDPFSPFPTTLLSPLSVNLSLGGRPVSLGVLGFFPFAMRTLWINSLNNFYR